MWCGGPCGGAPYCSDIKVAKECGIILSVPFKGTMLALFLWYAVTTFSNRSQNIQSRNVACLEWGAVYVIYKSRDLYMYINECCSTPYIHKVVHVHDHAV